MLLPTNKDAFMTKTQYESTNETKELRQSPTAHDWKGKPNISVIEELTICVDIAENRGIYNGNLFKCIK
jgi:hypothetical protein